MTLEDVKGGKILLASKHGKEGVLAPLFLQYFNAQVTTLSGIDTDSVGTFTREVERLGDIRFTLLEKCKLVEENENIQYIMASEGSFHPHSYIPFVYSNDEHLVLLDRRKNETIWAMYSTMDTNFGYLESDSVEKILSFAYQKGFPNHWMIVRDHLMSSSQLYKDIMDEKTLILKIEKILRTKSTCIIETDMRAMANPTRMKAIKNAGIQLIERLMSLCPQCTSSDFWVRDIERGLPCGQCGMPTSITKAHILSCPICTYSESRPSNDNKALPQYCDYCNP